MMGSTYLSVFCKNAVSDLEHLADELEHRIIGKLAQCELALGHIARIGFSKDGMSIARNNLARV